MPKTKAQKAVFTLLMAIMMVYGMETYNHLLQSGPAIADFTLPFVELVGFVCCVIVLQELIAGRLARRIARCFVDEESAKKTVMILAVQIATVVLMCPMMSAVATVIFKQAIAAPFVVKWIQTLALNLPMAFCWQLLVAGPCVRGIVKRVTI